MKTRITVLIIVLTLAFGTQSFAQDKTFTDGSVWSFSFIKANAGMGITYLNSLKTTWKAVQDEAVKQKLILSYKILSGAAASPDDYNLILMVEYKNLAAMEGQEAKWDAIQAKIVGNEDAQAKLRDARASQRTMYGQKLMREVVYK
jgi:hypothetical protein